MSPKGFCLSEVKMSALGAWIFWTVYFCCQSLTKRKNVQSLKSEDILINLVGASIGRVALGTPEVEGANCNQAVGFVRMECERSLKEFVVSYLLSPIGQQQMCFQKKDIARANLSLLDLRSFKVPSPPSEETEEIANVFRQLERKIEVCKQRKHVLDDLFRTLLHQLLTAQIRVYDLDLINNEVNKTE